MRIAHTHTCKARSVLAPLDAPGVPTAAGVPGSAPRGSRVPLLLSAALPWLRMLPNNDPEAPRLDGGAAGMRVRFALPAAATPVISACRRADAGAVRYGGSPGRTPLRGRAPSPASTIPPELSKSRRSDEELCMFEKPGENAGLPGPQLVTHDAMDCALVGLSSAGLWWLGGPPFVLHGRGPAGAGAALVPEAEVLLCRVRTAETADGTPLRLCQVSHCDSGPAPMRGVEPAVEEGARGMRDTGRGICPSGGRARATCTPRGGRGAAATAGAAGGAAGLA